MSELKAGVIHTPHDEGMTFVTDSDTISVNERETEFYLKSEADKVIEDLKIKLATAQQVLRLNEPEALFADCETMGRLSHEKDVVAREASEQKVKADKLHSCLKCLVMRDLIKDCPEKKSAIEIVKEYK